MSPCNNCCLYLKLMQAMISQYCLYYACQLIESSIENITLYTHCKYTQKLLYIHLLSSTDFLYSYMYVDFFVKVNCMVMHGL